MKRKPLAPIEPAVDPEILESARRSFIGDRLVTEPLITESARRAPRCVVCNGEATPATTEQLCWVCRRLKISAWRDAEQPPAQE